MKFKSMPLGFSTLVAFILILTVFFSGCNQPRRNSSLTDTSSLTSIDTTGLLGDSSQSSKLGNWVYSADEDEMTSKKTFFASIDAKELLSFDFPYDGGSTATLTIRKRNGLTNVYLRVSKGQFNSIYDGGSVKARFDNLPAKSNQFTQASDGSSDIIFIDAASSFIKKLKTHKKLLLQAEFYQSGVHTMEFNISNFKWAH